MVATLLYYYYYYRLRYRYWLSSINNDSGAWLAGGSSPSFFDMSNQEFVSAVCRRNTVKDQAIPRNLGIRTFCLERILIGFIARVMAVRALSVLIRSAIIC